MKKNIIFINSHPIQYFAPMYKYMNENGLKTDCWYCMDDSSKGGLDQEFGVKIKWDIPLLEGYGYRIFRNYSWKPSHAKGFFGLINFGMIAAIFKIPKAVIIVHGWHYFTLFFSLMAAKLRGHSTCLRCDVPNNAEAAKSGSVQKVKRFILKFLVFPGINYFLYVGEQNRQFYKSYGISDDRLLSCPYAVDNNRFQNEYHSLSNHKSALKQNLNIPESDKVIIFSGKYIDKKRPLDLLQAFGKLSNKKIWLVMIGEGELRSEMEAVMEEKKLKNVILTGFVNQSVISEYYAIGDLFVMCSGFGENWGLSVNEAMNFNLPLILSDLTGCADDLVKPGVNGYTFKTGNIHELAEKLETALNNPHLINSNSSLNLVNNYSYEVVTENLKTLV